MKYKTTSMVGAAVMAVFAFSNSAYAVPITGEIKIDAAVGTVINIDMTGNKVTFIPASPGVNAQVNSGTGVAITLAPANSGIIYADFQYDPLVVTNPIWTTVGGSLQFDLTSVNIDFEGTNGLILSGAGNIYSTTPGYDSTPGLWSFSANKTTQQATFAWSSTASAETGPAVPDGGTTVALLGISLLGLHGARRKFANR